MLDIETPYTFEIVHPVNRNLKTHAGVLEFHGDEDLIYMPNWVSTQLPSLTLSVLTEIYDR